MKKKETWSEFYGIIAGRLFFYFLYGTAFGLGFAAVIKIMF